MVARLLISIATAIILSVLSSCALAFLVYFPSSYVLLGGLPVILRLRQTLKRDIQLALKIIRVHMTEVKYRKENVTFHGKWQLLVARHPHKVAILFDDEQWTFQRINLLANRVANYLLLKYDFKVGESIALMLENCPEFIALQLALSQIGCPAALINTNLRDHQLSHCIKIASCKAVIVSSSLCDRVQQIEPQLDTDTVFFCLYRGDHPGCYEDIVFISQDSPNTPPTGRESQISSDSTLSYIYTSGTTGLPKACRILQTKSCLVGFAFVLFFNIVSEDVLYITLPLYHTSALLISFGISLDKGCQVCLKRKFSASQFFQDCVKHNCTVVFYIGELCRYLLAQPNKPCDTQHKVTKAIGNGLRPSLWNQFKDRFKIERVLEFYGATEGYSLGVNLVSKPGHLGYLLVSFKGVPFLKNLDNFNFLAKMDPETGELVRSRGLLVRCGPNEPGELLGIVSGGPEKVVAYIDKEATKKKIVRDVVTKGDTYVATGDVLSSDELGYLTFVDRKGDTFRWKGENVSTNEVESIITSIVGNDDVIVYAVSIPGTEGKAGMLAMVRTELDLESLLQKFRKSLPSYSVPLFLRLINAPDLTATFKYQKFKLKLEGYDITKVSDPIFFLDPRQGKYVLLDEEQYPLIMEEQLRF